jgi:hypothetical protein
MTEKKKDDRLFAPFPIEMDEHPKIIGLSDAAFRAIFEATFYSRRMLSDGFLDERVVLRRWGQEVADELSSNDPERPSWIRVEKPAPGWLIHDFERYQQPRDPSSRRPHIPNSVRAEVMKRDKRRCVLCGSRTNLSLDHVVRYRHGGRDVVGNLRVLCMPCNRKRR